MVAVLQQLLFVKQRNCETKQAKHEVTSELQRRVQDNHKNKRARTHL